MNANQLDQQLALRAVAGDAQAADFLAVFQRYVHAIDDIEDEPTTPEFRQHAFILALAVYNHPFYLAHRERLVQLIANITNTYADVVAWEKSEIPWQREWADHHRHCAAEMFFAVSGIVHGVQANRAKGLPGLDESAAYAAMRRLSQEFRVMCHVKHHDVSGRPD